MKKKMHVYIAAPYSIGNVQTNIQRAVAAGNQVAEYGHIPFIPHTHTHEWDELCKHPPEFWYEQDMDFVRTWADAVIRLSGNSAGADLEVTEARRLGKPIYYSVLDFLQDWTQ